MSASYRSGSSAARGRAVSTTCGRVVIAVLMATPQRRGHPNNAPPRSCRRQLTGYRRLTVRYERCARLFTAFPHPRRDADLLRS
jgi:hypothetical protein